MNTNIPFRLVVALLLSFLLTPSYARGQGAKPAASSAPPPVAAEFAPSRAVPRAECFPVERLPPDLRPLAEELLLKMLDSEALFTIVGGLKPMSSGYVSFRINTDMPELAEIERTRQALSAVRCGDAFSAELLVFRRVGPDKNRYVEGLVIFRPAYKRMVAQYADFWAPFAVTPGTDPLLAVTLLENDDTTARNRALGYLYGYPKPAVDFFVESADEQNDTKQLVPRDFRSIPTFSNPTNQFVYAVPKGSPETDVDRRLKNEAARILAAYRERRARYVGEGKPGVVALLRDWFDDGTGRCAPEHARFYGESAPTPTAGRQAP